MNKEAEFKIQGMLIATLTLGLFFTLLAVGINSSGNYNTDNIDLDRLNEYQTMKNITKYIEAAETQVDGVTPEKGAFDFFSDIWSKVTGPFKTIYKSFGVLKQVSISAVSDLNLHKAISDYLVAVLTVLVIIGIVMIKFYLGRGK
jgi:hypothetical protein